VQIIRDRFLAHYVTHFVEGKKAIAASRPTMTAPSSAGEPRGCLWLFVWIFDPSLAPSAAYGSFSHQAAFMGRRTKQKAMS
jgi:hypothetical protein